MDADKPAHLRPASAAYPALLQALAATHGHRTSFDRTDDDIALLGPASEDHAAWLAATHPDCRVWLLGEHHDSRAIAAWQREAGLSNLVLVENTLDELAQLMLPEFAIILVRELAGQLADQPLSELLSWCAGAVASGGLVWLCYDSLPGAAALGSLREIASAIAADKDDPASRHDAALAYFDELSRAGAPLLADNNAMSETYRRLLTLSEFERHMALFDDAFRPRHMTQLAGHCEDAGLAFAGACGRILSSEAALRADDLLRLTQAPADTLSIEQHLSFAMNEPRRADLYVRPAADTAAPWPLLHWIAADDADHDREKHRDWAALERAIAVDGHLPGYRTAADSTLASRHNVHALRRAIRDGRPSVDLTAVEAGCAVTVPTQDALWLRARAMAGDEHAAAWAVQEVDGLGKTVVVAHGPSGADAQAVVREAFRVSAARHAAYARFGLDRW